MEDTADTLAAEEGDYYEIENEEEKDIEPR